MNKINKHNKTKQNKLKYISIVFSYNLIVIYFDKPVDTIVASLSLSHSLALFVTHTHIADTHSHLLCSNYNKDFETLYDNP